MLETTDSDLGDEAIHVAEMMIAYGGSFARHLGEALMRADRHNRLKIKQTWPEYWAQYLEMYEFHKIHHTRYDDDEDDWG